MTWVRKLNLMVRWSVVTAALIALFWGIWYLINGSVPLVTAINLPGWKIQLPFAISRWWDVLIIPLCSVMIILIFTDKRIQENEDLRAELVVGLVFGLVTGLAYGLGFGLVFVLVTGLAYGLGLRLGSGLAYVLAYGLGYGLGFGLFIGLGYGLGGYGLLALILSAFSRRIADWLMAR